MASAEKGHTDNVKILIDSGANINKKIYYSHIMAYETALSLAADKGHQEVVELLIKSGANINEIVDDKGSTILDLLKAKNMFSGSKANRSNCIEILKKSGAKAATLD